jgi:hypothetical protein
MTSWIKIRNNINCLHNFVLMTGTEHLANPKKRLHSKYFHGSWLFFLMPLLTSS